MKLIANRQLRGEYGSVVPDQEFEAREEVAMELLAKGNARHARPPKVEYEVKIVVPAEAPVVSAREPFRHAPLLDAQPKTVDSEGHRVVSSTNIFEAGTTDPVGRSGRSGSASRR